MNYTILEYAAPKKRNIKKIAPLMKNIIPAMQKFCNGKEPEGLMEKLAIKYPMFGFYEVPNTIYAIGIKCGGSVFEIYSEEEL